MRRLTPLLVALALVLYWVMAVSVSPRMGVTADEVVHLTGGYTYWKLNDYRMHPENGTLPMRIAALPLLAMNLKLPPLTDPDWVNSKVNLYGEKFFYQEGNPVDAMLLRARMMIALTGMFTVWLTWRWARGLFGPAAGWLALGLAVFCPAMLAHGGLATSDMTMTACVLGALSAMWLLLHRATWFRLVLATVACGLAFLSKMSGVLIAPLILMMLLVRWLRPTPFVLDLGGGVRWLRRRAQIIVATLTLTLVAGAGSLVVLWAGYGFRYDGFNRARSATGGYYFTWDVILDKEQIPWPEGSALDKLRPHRKVQETTMTHLIGSLLDHHLLPEAYLFGFAHTYKFSRYRPAYFMGEYKGDGWKTFFPMAFLLKTTLPALALIAAGALALLLAGRSQSGAILRVRPWVYRASPLLIFFTVYWAMAINMHLNIGHRHILPTYPVFYIIASASTLWLAGSGRRLVVIALLAALALHAADSLNARPFYLSYFQPLSGGTDRGYRYLVDSSYDWGQGLPDLARWLELKKQRGDKSPVYLTYFGADSARMRGLDVTRFGDEINDTGARYFPAQLRGGWFVVSATHLTRVYQPVREEWNAADEALYRDLWSRLLSAQAAGPSSEARRLQTLQDAMDYEVLEFCRLSFYLQSRTPEEVIGGSLLVYHLTDAELAGALTGPVVPASR